MHAFGHTQWWVPCFKIAIVLRFWVLGYSRALKWLVKSHLIKQIESVTRLTGHHSMMVSVSHSAFLDQLGLGICGQLKLLILCWCTTAEPGTTPPNMKYSRCTKSWTCSANIGTQNQRTSLERVYDVGAISGSKETLSIDVFISKGVPANHPKSWSSFISNPFRPVQQCYWRFLLLNLCSCWFLRTKKMLNQQFMSCPHFLFVNFFLAVLLLWMLSLVAIEWLLALRWSLMNGEQAPV